MAERFWAFDWLQEAKVDPDNVSKLVQDDGFVRDLLDSIERAVPQNHDIGDEASIVAAADVDLGLYTCPHRKCLTQQAERLAHHAWYFDRVIVDDTSGRFQGSSARDVDRAELEGWLASLALLSELGADEFLHFEPKATLCHAHWKEHLAAVGLSAAVSRADDLIDALIPLSEVVEKTKPDGSEHYVVRTPIRAAGPVFPRAGNTLDKGEVLRNGVEIELRLALLALGSDLTAARKINSSLGTGSWFNLELLQSSDIAVTRNEIDRVAFELELPVLLDVPLKTVLRLRSDNRDAFVAFRAALKAAIKEKLEACDGSVDLEALGRSIRTEKINPEIQRIKREMKANASSLSRTAFVFGLGAVATTVGAFTGQAVPVAAGLMACGPSVGQVLRELRDRDSLKNSDYYFAFQSWKSSRHN